MIQSWLWFGYCVMIFWSYSLVECIGFFLTSNAIFFVGSAESRDFEPDDDHDHLAEKKYHGFYGCLNRMCLKVRNEPRTHHRMGW
jgi:hypothetical protein